MIKTLQHQVTALAALTQAVRLVQETAHQGKYQEEKALPLIRSLLQLEPTDITAIYGDTCLLRPGLELMVEQLGSEARVDTELARYATTLIFLERSLMKNPRILQNLREGLEQAQVKAAHFGIEHEQLATALADVYQHTLSYIRPRIIVHGSRRYLSSQTHADRIRCMLLAAVRAAVLWRQCGGSRWNLLFARNTIYREAVRQLESCRH